MKRILLVLLMINQLCYANDSLQISILTCAPGKEIYSIFGHSAIRVLDKENQVDKIYDFGTFDFNTPNFAYNFLKGKLQYHLSVRNTNQFIRAYAYENRKVVEQQLNLSKLEKRQIMDRLDVLYEPENRYYFYSFIQKNCSTDLRDILTFVGVKFSNQLLQHTKRDLINTHLKEKPWLKLGINIILGQKLEEKASRFQSMFLPIYLKEEMDQSFFHKAKLVESEQALNSIKSNKVGSRLVKLFSPIIIFSIILLIYLVGFQRKIKRLLFFGLGIGGLIITALWFFSGHEEVTNNLNVLWCNPLYLLSIPLLLKNKTNKVLTIILYVTLVMAIVVWVAKIQCFDISIVPLLITLGIINYNDFRRLAV